MKAYYEGQGITIYHGDCLKLLKASDARGEALHLVCQLASHARHRFGFGLRRFLRDHAADRGMVGEFLDAGDKLVAGRGGCVDGDIVRLTEPDGRGVCGVRVGDSRNNGNARLFAKR